MVIGKKDQIKNNMEKKQKKKEPREKQFLKMLSILIVFKN
jgi:hypothetical protein